MKAELYAPKEYWRLKPEQIAEVTNGCGPGRFGSLLVPDKIFGVDIKEACSIHDWMFLVGETIEDKREADRVFLNNMLRLIDAHNGSWFVNIFRRRKALAYHQAVADFGGPAFWKGKNPIENMKEVTHGQMVRTAH